MIGLEAYRNPLHTFIHMLCIISSLPIFKGYKPKTAKRMRGEYCSKIQKRELNKHFTKYFNLENEARCSLAESLHMTHMSLSEWMLRKWNKENNLQLERTKQQPQTLHQQEHGLDSAGTVGAFYL